MMVHACGSSYLGELLGPERLKLQLAMIMLLDSSLGNRARPCLKKIKRDGVGVRPVIYFLGSRAK